MHFSVKKNLRNIRYKKKKNAQNVYSNSELKRANEANEAINRD